MVSSIAIFVLVITILIYIWRHLRKVYSFWSNCGVKTAPFSYIWGHSRTPFLDGPMADQTKHIYNYLKSNGLKHGGLYVLQTPMYVPMDLDICKAILQRDFQHFVDKFSSSTHSDPLTVNLLSLKGKKWKAMRKKLTPIFAPGKMKMMFETMLQCTYGLEKAMDELEFTEVDIRDVMGRYTTDVIGSCAFGIECNSLEDPDNDFRQKGEAALEIPRDFRFTVQKKLFELFPKLMKQLKMFTVPKDVVDFFTRIVRTTVEYREQNGISRRDLMDLLIQLKNKGKLIEDEEETTENISGDDNCFSIDDLISESYFFFEAGHGTSSATMTFCLYELASNEDVQDKLRKEIEQVLESNDGKLTYDAVMDMPYLDMVLQETMRKYPPLPLFTRVCTKRYRVPGTEIVLEKGAKALIPVLGYQHDPLYYPDPDRFDPERFSEENKKGRHPMLYLPFGEGPRMCIGMRFALMGIKLGLVTLLKNYEFKVGSKTRAPFTWNPKNIILTVEGKIWLKHKQIES